MSALYDKARQAFLGGTLHWLTDTIKVSLIDTGNYIVDLSMDQYMNTNTIPLNARVGSGMALTGLTSYSGIADASDVTFASVSGVSTEAVVIWKDGGGGGVSVSSLLDPLIAYINSGTGLPFTPTGGDIQVQWDNGANKIFKL